MWPCGTRKDRNAQMSRNRPKFFITIPVSSKGPEFQPDLKYQPAAETENSGGKCFYPYFEVF